MSAHCDFLHQFFSLQDVKCVFVVHSYFDCSLLGQYQDYSFSPTLISAPCCAASFLFTKMRAGKSCSQPSGSRSVYVSSVSVEQMFHCDTEKSCLCFPPQQNEMRNMPAVWHDFAPCSCSSIIIAPVLA